VAVLTSTKLNEGFIARGYEMARYEEDIRRKQLEIEWAYARKEKEWQDNHDRRMEQYTAPPPPPLQSLRKRNKRLLLCHP